MELLLHNWINKNSKIEFPPLDWIYRSIRIMTVSGRDLLGESSFEFGSLAPGCCPLMVHVLQSERETLCRDSKFVKDSVLPVNRCNCTGVHTTCPLKYTTEYTTETGHNSGIYSISASWLLVPPPNLIRRVSALGSVLVNVVLK